MGIIRGISEDSVAPLIEAAISGGLETIEITMNTENVESLIAKAVRLAGNHLIIGAGTVLSVESLKSAVDAHITYGQPRITQFNACPARKVWIVELGQRDIRER